MTNQEIYTAAVKLIKNSIFQNIVSDANFSDELDTRAYNAFVWCEANGFEPELRIALNNYKNQICRGLAEMQSFDDAMINAFGNGIASRY